ncbi:hypothetical protein CDAR_124681 [Caerostris darwini]|uniref:Uncharacterized protein n=1 Tax=Caerostris darwini TaxID=1538125 RepID=A0AAV4RKZ0_9ARAC|nr:hypothetical protein CDAR_124681 [Caerostris darwini]
MPWVNYEGKGCRISLIVLLNAPSGPGVNGWKGACQRVLTQPGHNGRRQMRGQADTQKGFFRLNVPVNFRSNNTPRKSKKGILKTGVLTTNLLRRRTMELQHPGLSFTGWHVPDKAVDFHCVGGGRGQRGADGHERQMLRSTIEDSSRFVCEQHRLRCSSAEYHTRRFVVGNQ